MFHRTRLAACLLSTAALLGPIIPAASARADVSQCAPLTIDGQEAACITTSSTQVTDSDGNPGLQISITLTVYGQRPVTQTQQVTVPLSDVPCASAGRVAVPWPVSGQGDPNAFIYGYGSAFDGWCWGEYGLAIGGEHYPAGVTTPGVSTPTQVVNVPYHVPQICLTTSPGTCVGPYDGTISESVPVPTITSPPSATLGTPTQICLLSPPGSLNPDGSYPPFRVPLNPDADGTYQVGTYVDSQCLLYIPFGVPVVQGP